MSTTVKNKSGQTVAGAKRTKMYKALIAVGLDESAALVELGFEIAQPADPNDAARATLLAAGIKPERIEEILNAKATQGAPVEAAKPVKLTSKELGNQLVTERGLDFTNGRVYGGSQTAEAIVRVLKTHKPEIVESSGEGRTAGVLVFLQADATVALQNLIRPTA